MTIFTLPLALCRGANYLINYAINGALGAQSQQSAVNQVISDRNPDRDPGPIVTIPDEILKEIFFCLNPTDLMHGACVSKKWTLLASDPLKMAIYKQIAIGPEKYAEYLDAKTLELECQKAFASLPKNILEDRKMKSGAFPEETVGQTEILFWSVGSCTVNSCGSIFKKYLPDSKSGFAFKTDPVGDEYDKPSDKSRWVSMTIRVLPKTLNMPYKGGDGFSATEGQVDIIAQLAKETGLNYEVPTLNLTIQGMLAHLISTRRKQIGAEELEYLFKDVYTRVQERGRYGQMVVGGSGPAGSAVRSRFDFDHIFIGVAALRKF